MDDRMILEFPAQFSQLSLEHQRYILALEQALLSKEQAGGNLPTTLFGKDNQVIQWTIK